MTTLPAVQAPPSVLTVEALTFSYPNRHVFTLWSHRFAAGLTWIQGSNGSGKSTLLKLLTGALVPQAGQLVCSGFDQAVQPLDYRRNVFWCGPGPVAFDHLTPLEFFAFMRGLYPTVDDAALAQHLAGFALAPFINAPLCTLSSGTQRKVWLALALAAGTQVTLLDEPLNALDAASVAYLLAVLAALAQDASTRQRALIVASHDDLGPADAQAMRLGLDV
jgi:ABC-type multidrug transport system ATPase subunit